MTNSLHDKTEMPTFMTIIETVWENLIELGFAPGASMAWLKITDELETAVGDAGFVQKSLSENLPPSQAPYQRFGEIAPPDVVIGSSTSGPAVKPRPRMSTLPC